MYAKEPFAGPEVLLKYLTRYTHRVALSNGRLLAVEGEHVTLSYKDYADGCRPKEMTLTGVELLRRFALHVLPKGFVRVRQCGLLAHRDRRQRLALCRRLLAASPSTPPPAKVQPAPQSIEPTRVADPVESTPKAGPGPRTLDESALPVLVFLTIALSNKALGWLLACVLPTFPSRRCPSCGLGELQTIWERPRPRGPRQANPRSSDTS